MAETQKELLLKLSAKADSTVSRPMKELAQSAREAEREIDRVSNKSRQMASQGHGAVDAVSDRLGIPAGMTKLAAAMGMLAASVKMADTAVKSYYSSIERGQFSMELFNRSARSWVERNIPIYGELIRHGTSPAGVGSNKTDTGVYNFLARNRELLGKGLTASGFGGFAGLLPTHEVSLNPARRISDAEREYLMFREHQNVGLSHARSQMEADKLRRQSSIYMQMETARGERESDLGLRRKQFGISEIAAAIRSGAIDSITGQFGYSRQTQLEDAMHAIGFAEQRKRAGAESAAQLYALNTRQAETERQAKFFQGRHETALAMEQPLREQLRPFNELQRVNEEMIRRRSRGEDISGLQQRQRELHAQTGGKTVEEEMKMRLQLQALEAQTAQAREQSNTATQQALDVQLQKENAIREAQQKQADLLRAQHDSLAAIGQAEKMRLKNMGEGLGLMHPMQLRTALGISRKIKAGLAPTQAEIGFMQSNRDIFGSQLQQLGAQRASTGPYAGMIQELMRNTGQFERGKEIEKQMVEVKHALTLNLNKDEAMTKQIADIVTKAMMEFKAQVDIQLKNRLDALGNGAISQSRAQYGQY